MGFYKQDSYVSIAEKADYCSYIDGWRGVAILLVVAVHTSQICGNNGHGIFLTKYSETFFNSGARGVQLFFILSAFTLFNSSYRRFKRDSHPKLFFYLRRSFRILPLWWILTAIYCYLDNKSLLAGGLSASFLFGFFRFDNRLEVVPGGWSLFVEETFYFMLPVVFGYITSLRRAFYFTLVLIIVAKVWWASHGLRLPIPDTNYFLYLFPLNYWYFFGVGILLYYIIRKEKWQDHIPPNNFLIWDVTSFLTMPMFVADNHTVVGAIFAFCIYVSSREGTLLNKIMNNKILMRFGVYCYSIYLLHFAILTFFAPPIQLILRTLRMQNLPVEFKFCIAFLLVTIISMIVGYFCFNLIERPSVNFGKIVINKIDYKLSILPDTVKIKM